MMQRSPAYKLARRFLSRMASSKVRFRQRACLALVRAEVCQRAMEALVSANMVVRAIAITAMTAGTVPGGLHSVEHKVVTRSRVISVKRIHGRTRPRQWGYLRA